MIELTDELRNIRVELRVATEFKYDLAYSWTLDSLLTNINAVGKAWSGSWYGYQAYVYYKNFDPPPTGIHFNHNWGFEVDPFGESREESSWSEYSHDEIMSVIEEGIGGKNIEIAVSHTPKWIDNFKNKKEDVLSIIKIAQESNGSHFDNLLDQIEKLEVKTEDEIIANARPIEMVTVDPIAIQQGIRTPPHIQVEARVHWSIGAVGAVEELGKLVERTIAQMERVHRKTTAPQITGTKIFIGHGRSQQWRELKDFLQVRLKQDVDEFNRIPPAGRTIIDRLSEVLDHAKFAFLILTGEDENKAFKR